MIALATATIKGRSATSTGCERSSPLSALLSAQARPAWRSTRSGCGFDGTSVDRSVRARCYVKSTCRPEMLEAASDVDRFKAQRLRNSGCKGRK